MRSPRAPLWWYINFWSLFPLVEVRLECHAWYAFAEEDKVETGVYQVNKRYIQ
jgi:hypothetical protein